MKISEVQKQIFEQTGLKTTVKHNKGSMKNHITIRPLFQNGAYQNFPFDWLQIFKSQFKQNNGVFPYFTVSGIDLPASLFEFDPIQYPKERKQKSVDENSTVKGWGSKNSQLRLDKASRRYAKHLNKGNCARYY